MPSIMNESLIHTLEQLARRSVEEVFAGMLDIRLCDGECAPVEADSSGQVVGSVGFVGQINGVIHLRAGLALARLITGRMLRLSESQSPDDDMINDAIGELGNVVVGKVKSHLCDAGHSCVLTVPSIMRGEQLCTGEIRNSVRRAFAFRHNEHALWVEVVLAEDACRADAEPAFRPRILTVDDSRLVRLRVGKALAPCNCVLLEASNGAEGLDLARGEKPDLILLDYTMPVMDGLDTMTALRADPELQSVPVIMLTAEGSRTTMVQMASLGVRDYLLKPFQDDVLLDRVRRALGITAAGTPAIGPN